MRSQGTGYSEPFDMGEAMMSLTGEPETRAMRVLLVDDELSLGVTLGRALGDDFLLDTSTTMHDALALLARTREYDAILCDVNMPDGSGETLYRTIARRWPGLEERVVFITGGIFDDRTQRFLDAVTNRCLEKPFDVSTLESILRAQRRMPTVG